MSKALTVTFRFRLYIARNAPNSVRAQSNLAAICHKHVADRFEIELVDVLEAPGRALMDGVLLTPTLVRLSPTPVRQIIGDLRDEGTVLQLLGLS